jgi:PIN like domain
MRCVLHPDGLPDLFIDRSLGRIQVPDLLRAVGLRLITLADHYGIPADQDIEDVTWLELAGQCDWVVFMKDAEIRRRPAERAAVKSHAVRAFCLSAGSLPAADMASRFIDNLRAITDACANPGPFMYAVHASRITRLSLD